MDQKLLDEIDAAYDRLERKQEEIVHALPDSTFETESGWYNGHYHRSAAGDWHRESYPIPVISVKDICDIELQFDKISVSAKLKREDALKYSFEKFSVSVMKWKSDFRFISPLTLRGSGCLHL